MTIAFKKWPSRLKRKLRELPLIEAIANRISDRRFRAWQANNPDGTFGDYYAAKTIAHRDLCHLRCPLLNVCRYQFSQRCKVNRFPLHR